MRRWTTFAGVVLLAALANAGLMATWFVDMQRLVAVPINDGVVFLGIILVGTFIALIIDDLGRGALAMVLASILGSTLFGLAIAAPGFAVPEVRITLINRGTTYGLAALLISALFGLIGMVVAWGIEAFGQRGMGR